MIHYIYRIDFLCGEPEGRYYLGKRSYHGKDINKDKYAGSGDFCFCYYSKHGKIIEKTYKKTILEINDTWEINRDREGEIVGDLWKTDPLCMNQMPGGVSKIPEGRKRKVVQYDLQGNVLAEYNSITEAQEITGVFNVVSCCNGKSNFKTAGGYIWRYKNDPFDKYIVPEMTHSHPEARKKVNQYTLDGKYIKTWNSLREAAVQYSNSKRSFDYLSEAINGKVNSWYGYVWRIYNGSIEDIEINVKIRISRKIQQFDLNGNFIAEFNNANQAAKTLGIDPGNIGKCAKNKVKSAGGYVWKYV